MKVHVFDIEWDLYDEDRGENITREEAGLPEEVELEFDDDEDPNTEIANQLSDDYDFCVKSFDWEVVSVEDQIKKVLNKYFDGNDDYDPNYSAQDAIDEIAAIINYL